MILLLETKNRAPITFKQALERVFRARNTHPLPEVLPQPPSSWQKTFTEMAAECCISQNLQEGFKKVSDFYSSLQRMNST